MYIIKFVILIGIFKSCEGAEQGCRDILQNFLSGQQSSPIGIRQLKALETRMKNSIESLNGDVQTALRKSDAEIKRKLKLIQQKGGGDNTITYIRWGRRTCPSHSDTVYSGWVGGSHYSHIGGAAEPLCLPRDPEWGIYVDGNDGSNAYIYGAEYELGSLKDERKQLNNHDVPCALCMRKGKSSVQVIPARTTCHKGWSREYTGYLMAGHYGHKRATKYTCIDARSQKVFGGHASHDGYLFYKVEGVCGSLKCPPYVAGREITCVVCSS